MLLLAKNVRLNFRIRHKILEKYNEMVSQKEIWDFLRTRVGDESIAESSDIFGEYGFVGDDFHEIIEEYAKTYQVNMSNYLWYFHSDEEGQNYGGILFKAPYKRVERISIIPKVLYESALKGIWEINYPEHKLHKRGYVILINQVLVLLFLTFQLYKVLI